LHSPELERRDVEPGQPVGRGPAERRRQREHPALVSVGEHLALLGRRERAALHHPVDRLLGVPGHDVVGDHLVLDHVRLELDALDPGVGRVVDHAVHPLEVAVVVDAELGDHERTLAGTDPAGADGQGPRGVRHAATVRVHPPSSATTASPQHRSSHVSRFATEREPRAAAGT
jgi:hypothetical protein